jgi:hypothetical protein
MKLKELLNKSGILRSGTTTATYKSGKDRPTEFLMDNVYDEKKDLTTKDDIKKAKAAAVLALNNKSKSTIGKKIFFWSMVALAALFLLMFLGSESIWVIIIGIILVMGFIYLTFRFAYQGVYTWMLAIIGFFVFFVFSLILVPSSDDSVGVSTVPAMSYEELLQYDKKVVNISSADGKLTGTAGFTVGKDNKDKPYLDTYYNLYINDSLPKNSKPIDGLRVGTGYDYINNLVDATNESGEGDLRSIFCNKDQPISDPFKSSSTQYNCNGEDVSQLTTELFLASFSRWYRNYDEFLQKTAFELYDSSNYWEEEKDDTGVSSWSVDDDLVVSEGPKVREYKLTFNQ